ncbi:MAG: helix-turn-helix transcriptional regulator [Oscillospiraceae bacterium]|nr:helix-turn-helix transcriptional regulator [Oscillospiraceae bacterium]
MDYTKRIRELREDHEPKISQKDIAMLLGTTQQYYSEYENGKRKLPIEHLIKLCSFYGVSADYIIGLPKGLKHPEG